MWNLVAKHRSWPRACDSQRSLKSPQQEDARCLGANIALRICKVQHLTSPTRKKKNCVRGVRSIPSPFSFCARSLRIFFLFAPHQDFYHFDHSYALAGRIWMFWFERIQPFYKAIFGVERMRRITIKIFNYSIYKNCKEIDCSGSASKTKDKNIGRRRFIKKTWLRSPPLLEMIQWNPLNFCAQWSFHRT